MPAHAKPVPRPGRRSGPGGRIGNHDRFDRRDGRLRGPSATAAYFAWQALPSAEVHNVPVGGVTAAGPSTTLLAIELAACRLNGELMNELGRTTRRGNFATFTQYPIKRSMGGKIEGSHVTGTRTLG
jgi:hypothetical protein